MCVAPAIQPGCGGEPRRITQVSIVRGDDLIPNTGRLAWLSRHDSPIPEVPEEVSQGRMGVRAGTRASTAGERPGDVDRDGRERLAAKMEPVDEHLRVVEVSLTDESLVTTAVKVPEE